MKTVKFYILFGIVREVRSPTYSVQQTELPCEEVSESFNCHLISRVKDSPVRASVFAWVFLVARDPSEKMSERTEN